MRKIQQKRRDFFWSVVLRVNYLFKSNTSHHTYTTIIHYRWIFVVHMLISEECKYKVKSRINCARHHYYVVAVLLVKTVHLWLRYMRVNSTNYGVCRYVHIIIFLNDNCTFLRILLYFWVLEKKNHGGKIIYGQNRKSF